jgi:probable F420-dependent oxidoreductase
MLQWTEGTEGAALVDAAQRFESLGYHELWIPEVFGRESFSTCGYLLGKTERLRVSSGIANVYARDADAAAQAANGLAEFSGGRFSLGLGVSHPVLIEPRGHQWQMPVPVMRAYLDHLLKAPIESPMATHPAPIIVAAHGPGLLKVASKRADGALVFLQPLETIKKAREILGPDKELHAVVRCVLDPDPASARDLARRACAFYISLPAYHAAWGRVGFEESDWATGGSDRLVDAICAWGDVDALQRKFDEFIAAGATHIVLYTCNPGEEYLPESAYSKQWHWDLLEALAPAKTG